MDEHFITPEQAIIERLEQAPQPTLDKTAVDALHQRLLEQVDLSQAAFQQTQLKRWQPISHSHMTVAAAGLVTAVVGGLLLLSFISRSGSLTSPTENAPATLAVASVNLTQTATLIVSASQTPQAPTVIIEGEIQAISGNVITVNRIPVLVQADDPILRIVEVGDVIYIEAIEDSANKLQAMRINNLLDENTTATTFLEGRIEAINKDSVVINSITVKLPADDPRRKDIQVGTFLSIDGYFQGTGANSILIIVKVTVVEETDIEIFIQCKSRHGMGMGEVPDAMGMGDPQPPAMGMGELPDAMGMGNPQPPAMGMGEVPDAMGMGDPQPPAMGMGELPDAMGMGDPQVNCP
jgi:hypothetical protein